ncbi:hypothetical protein BSKO_12034 [Bryopsis sp. KO-2023]|nr:hypothetical protein BSKO_12034 [Bryopsis sp. KO-2023]
MLDVAQRLFSRSDGVSGVFDGRKVSPLASRRSFFGRVAYAEGSDACFREACEFEVEEDRARVDGDEGGTSTEAATSWDSIPEPLLQQVFRIRMESDPGWSGRKDLYAASAVCRGWRAAAADMLFEGLWEASPMISHPAQLFALSPMPVRGGLVKCYIRREDISGGIGPPQHRYDLHLWSDRSQSAGKFLVSAVQHSRNTKALHLSKSVWNAPCGKLVSNMWGSRYRLARMQGSVFNGCPFSVGIRVSDVDVWGIIKYKLRMKGMMRPRRLTVLLPHPTNIMGAAKNGKDWRNVLRGRSMMQASEFHWLHQPDEHDNLDGQSTSPGFHHKECIKLVNKAPHWNDGLKCWCLNFRGRVKLASVKNFQLMCRNDVTGRIVMQFGKADTNCFIMDYNPTVISAVQAFGIALTSFDGGVIL